MARVELLYRWLARLQDSVADEILTAALERAEPEYAERIADVLLSRSRETAWTALVANYDRLTESLRERVQSKPQLLRTAVGCVLNDQARARGRANALALLREHPCLSLSYLVADALRAPQVLLRQAAGDTLLRFAEQVRASPGPERGDVVAALREGLRTYDLHKQNDVLRACLWFAKDLHDDLWSTLNNPQSTAGQIVRRRLPDWNDPHLAAFLLLGLAQPGWREVAKQILDTWYQPRELAAIVHSSDLLDRADVREALRCLQQPQWFLNAIPLLDKLPLEVRGLLPYWACHLGFSNLERVKLLEKWQQSPHPEVHRASIYALAALDTPEADEVVMRVATRDCPMRAFAAWFAAGKRTMALRARQRKADANRTAAATAAQSEAT